MKATIKNINHNVIDTVFLSIYFIFTLFIGLFLIWFYNGLSPDSIIYTLGAESIIEFDNYGVNIVFLDDISNWMPIIRFPPLFPFVISVFVRFGLGPYLAGRLVSILSYSLTLFPLFLLSRRIISSLSAHCCCIFWLLFSPGIYVASWVWSETLFVFLLVLILFLISKSIELDKTEDDIQNKYKIILNFIIGLLFGLLTITKWIGGFFTGLILLTLIVYYIGTIEIKDILFRISLIIFGWLLPVFPILTKNYLESSTFFGSRSNSDISIMVNFRDTIQTFMLSFMGFSNLQSIYNIFYLVILVLAFIIFLIIILKKLKDNFRGFNKEFLKTIKGSGGLYLFLVFIIVSYMLFLIILRSLIFFDEITFRLMFPIFPFVILLIFMGLRDTINQLLSINDKLSFKQSYYRLRYFYIILLLFLIYAPQFKQFGIISGAKKEEPGLAVSLPSTSPLKEGLNWIIENTSENSIILTNSGAEVAFYTERTAVRFPILSYYGSVSSRNEIESGINNHNVSFIIIFRYKLGYLDYGNSVDLLAKNELPENIWNLLFISNQTTIYGI